MGVYFYALQFRKTFFRLQPQLILFLFHQKIETHKGIQEHISGMHAEDGEWSVHGDIFLSINFFTDRSFIETNILLLSLALDVKQSSSSWAGVYESLVNKSECSSMQGLFNF